MLVYVFATSCTNQGKNGTKIDKPPVLSQEHKSESKDKKDGKDSKGGIDEHYMNKVKEMSDMPELSDKQEDSEMISAVDSLLQSYYVNNGLDLCQFEQFLSNISTNNNTSTNTNNVMISAGEQNTCVLSLNNYKIYLQNFYLQIGDLFNHINITNLKGKKVIHTPVSFLLHMSAYESEINPAFDISVPFEIKVAVTWSAQELNLTVDSTQVGEITTSDPKAQGISIALRPLLNEKLSKILSQKELYSLHREKEQSLNSFLTLIENTTGQIGNLNDFVDLLSEIRVLFQQLKKKVRKNSKVSLQDKPKHDPPSSSSEYSLSSLLKPTSFNLCSNNDCQSSFDATVSFSNFEHVYFFDDGDKKQLIIPAYFDTSFVFRSILPKKVPIEGGTNLVVYLQLQISKEACDIDLISSKIKRLNLHDKKLVALAPFVERYLNDHSTFFPNLLEGFFQKKFFNEKNQKSKKRQKSRQFFCSALNTSLSEIHNQKQMDALISATRHILKLPSDMDPAATDDDRTTFQELKSSLMENQLSSSSSSIFADSQGNICTDALKKAFGFKRCLLKLVDVPKVFMENDGDQKRFILPLRLYTEFSLEKSFFSLPVDGHAWIEIFLGIDLTEDSVNFDFLNISFRFLELNNYFLTDFGSLVQHWLNVKFTQAIKRYQSIFQLYMNHQFPDLAQTLWAWLTPIETEAQLAHIMDMVVSLNNAYNDVLTKDSVGTSNAAAAAANASSSSMSDLMRDSTLLSYGDLQTRLAEISLSDDTSLSSDNGDSQADLFNEESFLPNRLLNNYFLHTPFPALLFFDSNKIVFKDKHLQINRFDIFPDLQIEKIYLRSSVEKKKEFLIPFNFMADIEVEDLATQTKMAFKMTVKLYFHIISSPQLFNVNIVNWQVVDISFDRASFNFHRTLWTQIAPELIATLPLDNIYRVDLRNNTDAFAPYIIQGVWQFTSRINDESDMDKFLQNYLGILETARDDYVASHNKIPTPIEYPGEPEGISFDDILSSSQVQVDSLDYPLSFEQVLTTLVRKFHDGLNPKVLDVCDTFYTKTAKGGCVIQGEGEGDSEEKVDHTFIKLHIVPHDNFADLINNGRITMYEGNNRLITFDLNVKFDLELEDAYAYYDLIAKGKVKLPIQFNLGDDDSFDLRFLPVQIDDWQAEGMFDPNDYITGVPLVGEIPLSFDGKSHVEAALNKLDYGIILEKAQSNPVLRAITSDLSKMQTDQDMAGYISSMGEILSMFYTDSASSDASR